jgi:hypothetical protein
VASRWAQTLTTEEPNPKLDLADYVGQRSATFVFELVNIVTGYRTTVNPLKNSIPTLTHNVGSTIKRQISGLFLGVLDTSRFDVISSRLEVFMYLEGVRWPLGRYIPNGQVAFESTGGEQSTVSFYDEGFIVDQQLSEGFGSLSTTVTGESLQVALDRLLSPLPITFTIEPSPFAGIVAWSTGARRGYVVEQMALDGDWFSPWFDNTNVMRFIRTFDPATAIPTFDYDAGNQVLRDRVLRSNDLVTAPNQFVVVSNGVSASGSNSHEVVGLYDVPDSAPHSALNRGFLVTETVTRQLTSSMQAQAVAQNLGLRQTIFETTELHTAPDPRHDAYDVIRWQGSNWLELTWSLPLIEGSQMQHMMRKAYLS